MSSSLQESELITILNSLGSIAGHSSNEQKQHRIGDELVNKLKYDRVFVTNKPAQRPYFDDSDVDDDDDDRGVISNTAINKQRIENEWNSMDKYHEDDIKLSDEEYESQSSDSDYYPQNRRLRKKKAPKTSNTKKTIIKGKKKENPKGDVKNTNKSTRTSIKKVLIHMCFRLTHLLPLTRLSRKMIIILTTPVIYLQQK